MSPVAAAATAADKATAPGAASEAGSDYTAVIRTDHASPLLLHTVACLRAQTLPPTEIVFVDSSRDPAVRAALLALGDRVVSYPPERPFNFSEAINLGCAAVHTPWTLLISSHVQLTDTRLVAMGIKAMSKHGARVAYWTFASDGLEQVQHVDARSFDGRNGLSNSCALLPTALVRERPFRPEVFSAEDQEWASWFLRERGGATVRITHPAVAYCNQRVNTTKTVNEELAIAYFSYRRGLWPDRVLARLLRAALAAVRGRRERALMHWRIATGLVACWFRPPSKPSRYY
jgi:glycosyltransferase involved in cell wall biosynthesis